MNYTTCDRNYTTTWTGRFLDTRGVEPTSEILNSAVLMKANTDGTIPKKKIACFWL